MNLNDPDSKHSAVTLARRDVGESALFDLAGLRDLAEALQGKIEHASRRYEHIVNGGKPDDPVATWRTTRCDGDKP